MKEPDISSLEHTSWRCQYHVVFAPKYRRMEIYREIRVDVGVILRKLCQQKGVEIIEANACPDHIHMLISIPPKYSVSQIMRSANLFRPLKGRCPYKALLGLNQASGLAGGFDLPKRRFNP